MVSDPPSSGSPPTEPSVRIIRGAVRAVRASPRRVLAVVIAVIVAVGVFDAIYRVDVGYSGTLQRFGRLVATDIQPGLHIRFPFGIDQVTILPTQRTQSLAIGGSGEEPIGVITGDNNIVLVDLIVQYRIADPAAFLFVSDSPREILGLAARTALTQRVADKTVDWTLAHGKTELQHIVRDMTQGFVDPLGIDVLSVNLLAVNPPPQAISAFRDINDARAESVRYQEQAAERGEFIVARASGDAARILADAEAQAHNMVAQAKADAAAFRLLLAEYRRTPEQTKLTLYRRMTQVLVDQINVIAIAPGQGKNLKFNLLEDGNVFPPFGGEDGRATAEHHGAPSERGGGMFKGEARQGAVTGRMMDSLPAPHAAQAQDHLPGSPPHVPGAEPSHLPSRIQQEAGGTHDPTHSGGAGEDGESEGEDQD